MRSGHQTWDFHTQPRQQPSGQQEVSLLRRPRFAATLLQARKWTETKSHGTGRQARPKSEYLSPDEVAKNLKVTPRTVYRWLESGQLPAEKVGRTWRVSYGDMEKKRNG